MATRALLGVLLFGGSFVVGLAGTWAWITSTPGGDGAGMAPPMVADPTEDDASDKGMVATAILPIDAPEQEVIVAAPEAVVERGNPVRDAPIQAREVKEPAARPQPAVASAAPVVRPIEKKRSAPLWGNLIGKTCSVSLESVGFRTLSIRDGELESGSVVDWDRDFSTKARTHLLRAGKDTAVQVLGIGVDPAGAARVAHVRSVKSGKTGVISLLVEEKRVPLVILDGDR